MIRRCPQCGTASDDMYGFCIKCGYEFQEIPQGENTCPLCGFPNPDEADFCVKCGTPLLFKGQFENANNNINPIIIKKQIGNTTPNKPHTSRFIIALGYLFTILGSIIGLIFAIYLITRKDPVARKHGIIQLVIIIFYVALIAALIATGIITPEMINRYGNLTFGNFTR